MRTGSYDRQGRESAERVSMTSTKSVFDALTPRQLEAMCNVAFGGNGGGVPRRTLESLERKGLIERVEKEDGRGGLLFCWHEWAMPLGVHIDFCAWCAEQGGQSK